MTRPKTFATACVVGCLLISGAFNAAAQEARPEEMPPPPPAPDRPSRKDELEIRIGKLLHAYDVSPQPLPEIPDNPPPHEGAMIDMPAYRIEPPDLILVEVIEALPGRPITGERLVRPDGTITLGFYGEIHVRGLTIEQVKVKIIKHLRKYLPDDVLGLCGTTVSFAVPDGDSNQSPFEKDKDLPSPSPQEEKRPLKKQESPQEPLEKPKGVSNPGTAASKRVKIRSVSDTKQSQSHVAAALYFARRLEPSQVEQAEVEEPSKPEDEPTKPIDVSLQNDAEITIRINVKKETNPAPGRSTAEIAGDAPEELYNSPIPPQDSDRVFVDVTQYNSKNYYVLGHVAEPGKLPITGNETVLDALQYAGGQLQSADSRDIRLVRPGREGKPGKVYKVDLEAIRERGETATNYQIFPGDRIVVGANELAYKKAQIERLSAEVQEKALREKLAAPKPEK